MEEGTEYTSFAFDERVSKDLDPTKQMIVQLALELDFTKHDYVLYLDNLFTNVPLLKALKQLPVGATGTTRKNAIGIPMDLLELKQKNSELVWNSVLSRVVEGVNVFLWQDNNAVIGKITLYIYFKGALRDLVAFYLQYFVYSYVYSSQRS
jgi:hypothetical protein